MAKEFTYKGKSLDELKKMNAKEFAELVPSRQKRSLTRGLSEEQKNLLAKLKKGKNRIKTHAREMIIIPEMLDKTFLIHNGKAFIEVKVIPEMLGHRLGEFSLTRNRVAHHAPGIGATRSSASMSVK